MPAIESRTIYEKLEDPRAIISRHYESVYTQGDLAIGAPAVTEAVFEQLARQNTICIAGAQYGDEGKGRLIDDSLTRISREQGIKNVVVIRYAGGSNAGHTVYTPDGQKIALHQVPSGVVQEQAVCLMERGMVLHPEDLATEIIDAEQKLGRSLNGSLIVHPEAIMVTDLHRAEEVLNRELSQGKADGGTGRGISPAYAHALTRTGNEMGDLFRDNWNDLLGAQYDIYQRTFAGHGRDIATALVPDFRETRRQGAVVNRTVGSKEEFLHRLGLMREWFMSREAAVPAEQRMFQNTFPIHRKMYRDVSMGILFEGAQAMGLHAWLGRRPDVTASDTGPKGILSSTGFWDYTDLSQVVGVAKATYMSSVGAGKPITMIDLPSQLTDEDRAHLSPDQEFAAWTREEAHEYGTTTGRPRDICYMDLPFMTFNIRTGGLRAIAFTHLDIARADMPVRVCTHYTDADGNLVAYQPGLRYQEGLTPHYIDLPGWDGSEVQNARSFDDLPLAAKQYLSFMERCLGVPVVAATTGPKPQDYFRTV